MKEKEDVKLTFFLNLSFSLFELIGGIFTNSISILCDSIHDFGDSISIGVTFFLEKLSLKEKNNEYTYGYKRYSNLGEMIASLILFIFSLVIIIASCGRLLFPLEVKPVAMMIFSVFGILINGYAVYKTSTDISKDKKSVNLQVLGDVIGWIAVLIVSLLIKITNLDFLDSLLAIIIAILVILNSLKNIFGILDVFLEKKPNNVDIEKIQESILKLNDVNSIQDIHIWSLDGISNIFTAHILINKTTTKANFEKIKKEIKKELEKQNINHSTIELEYQNNKEKNVKK